MSEEQIPISQAIAELEEYRQRLIDDTIAIAKKVKASKRDTMARLEQHPEIIKIDKMIEEFRARAIAAREASQASKL